MAISVEEAASLIDHTILRPDVSWTQLESILNEAKKYPFAALVVPPWYVKRAASIMSDSPIRIGTVGGFPLGFQAKEVKLAEVGKALEDGASEVDVVMNICAFKSGDYRYVVREIEDMARLMRDKTLKIIIETAYLSREEKILACNLVIDGGATFVKTSTGLGPGGARAEDVKLLKEVSKGKVKIKASGGIRDLKKFVTMVEAGSDRIGTSSGLSIIKELERGYGRKG